MERPIWYAIQDFAVVTGLNCDEIVASHSKEKEKDIWRGKENVNSVI